MGKNSRPLRVWLVEHNNPFAAAGGTEPAAVRRDIQARLRQWFTQVVQHRNASADRPAGYTSQAEVAWTDLATPSQVGDRDLVIYFGPSPFSTSPPANPPQTVHAGPYRTAAGQLSDADVRDAILAHIGDSDSGGHTLRVTQGNYFVPILSEVFVLYNPGPDNLQARVQQNVLKLAASAFHEAGHNKADRLHEDGGGGLFADVYQGQHLTPANVAFLASHIWSWGPQYIRGQPLTPVAPPP
jgi:hypothetical protein